MGKASRKKQLQKQPKQSPDVKMSQALLDISEPFRTDEDSIEKLREIITLAATAWDIAILPEQEQIETLMKAVEKNPTMKQDLEADIDKFVKNGYQINKVSQASLIFQAVAVMIQRKKELYPDDNRSIVEFSVEDTPRGYHIKAAAMTPAKSFSIKA
jgi:hypothetical protein